MTRPTSNRMFVLMTAFAMAVSISRLTLGQTVNAGSSANPGEGYRISGVVVSKSDGNPLTRARVTLADTNNRQNLRSQITIEGGMFDFHGLPAGKYSLQAAKGGYIAAGYDQHEQFFTAIVTGAGLDTNNLTLKLAPDAIIWGKVLDESGEPVRHATVTLYGDSHQGGINEVRRFRIAQTDDLGAYELTRITPGTYFLSASATPWYAIHPPSQPSDPQGNAAPSVLADRSLDVAYPTTYYSDATEADGATAIPVAGGARIQIDFHFNPVPALHLLLRVPGDNKTGFASVQLEKPEFDSPGFIRGLRQSMVSPGLMEISGVPAGRYNIRLHAPGSEGVGMQMDGVELTKDGEEIDASAAPPLSNVKVSVQVAGQDTVPPELSIGLRSKGWMFTGIQKLDSKGQAEIKNITAARYEVVVLGSTKRYSITHISAEGAEVTGHAITVAAGTSPSLSLTLSEGSAELQGVAKRAGKGFAGAMVVLVPKEPEGNSDLFHRDQSDLDGTFTLRDIAPGTYILLAIENGWDLEWSKPSVISAYLKRGKIVDVTGRPTHPVVIAEPIEVQPR